MCFHTKIDHLLNRIIDWLTDDFWFMSFVADRSSFTIDFSNFYPQSGPGIPISSNRKTCQLSLGLQWVDDCSDLWMLDIFYWRRLLITCFSSSGSRKATVWAYRQFIMSVSSYFSIDYHRLWACSRLWFYSHRHCILTHFTETCFPIGQRNDPISASHSLLSRHVWTRWVYLSQISSGWLSSSANPFLNFTSLINPTSCSYLTSYTWGPSRWCWSYIQRNLQPYDFERLRCYYCSDHRWCNPIRPFNWDIL